MFVYAYFGALTTSAQASNATAIGANTASIVSNTTEIGINTNSIASNATEIGINTNSIASNATAIGANTASIVSNATEIEKVSKGVSMSMAMDGIPQAFGGQSVIGVGIGRFDGHSALAIGGSYHDDENGITYSLKLLDQPVVMLLTPLQQVLVGRFDLLN